MKWINSRLMSEEIGKRCLNCGAFYIKSARRKKNWAKGYESVNQEEVIISLEKYKITEQNCLDELSKLCAEESILIPDKPEKVNFSFHETFSNLDLLLNEMGCSSILDLAIKYNRLKLKLEWSKDFMSEVDTTEQEEEIQSLFVEQWEARNDNFLNFKRV